MTSEPPKVLISYSHDSPEHARRVLELSERLRVDGIDVQIDQYVAGTPTEGWPRWMLDRLDWANFILSVCTETYYRRFRGHEEPGQGKGADFEGQLFTLAIYHAKSKTDRFVPVFFEPKDERFIPELISGHTHYLLSSEDNYAKLYAFLTGQAGIVPVELGLLKRLAHEAVEPLRFGNAEAAGKLHGMPELRFIAMPLQSFWALGRTGDQPGLQIVTRWNVTNTSNPASSVRLLTARLIKPRVPDPEPRAIVSTGTADGNIHSNKNVIPAGGTREVSIHFYVVPAPQRVRNPLEVCIVATDQFDNQHKLPAITLRCQDRQRGQ